MFGSPPEFRFSRSSITSSENRPPSLPRFPNDFRTPLLNPTFGTHSGLRNHDEMGVPPRSSRGVPARLGPAGPVTVGERARPGSAVMFFFSQGGVVSWSFRISARSFAASLASSTRSSIESAVSTREASRATVASSRSRSSSAFAASLAFFLFAFSALSLLRLRLDLRGGSSAPSPARRGCPSLLRSWELAACVMGCSCFG